MKLNNESLNYILSELKRRSSELEKDEQIINYLNTLALLLLEKYNKLKQGRIEKSLFNSESKIQDITNILRIAPNKGLFSRKFNTFNNSIIHIEDNIFLLSSRIFYTYEDSDKNVRNKSHPWSHWDGTHVSTLPILAGGSSSAYVDPPILSGDLPSYYAKSFGPDRPLLTSGHKKVAGQFNLVYLVQMKDIDDITILDVVEIPRNENNEDARFFRYKDDFYLSFNTIDKYDSSNTKFNNLSLCITANNSSGASMYPDAKKPSDGDKIIYISYSKVTFDRLNMKINVENSKPLCPLYNQTIEKNWSMWEYQNQLYISYIIHNNKVNFHYIIPFETNCQLPITSASQCKDFIKGNSDIFNNTYNKYNKLKYLKNFVQISCTCQAIKLNENEYLSVGHTVILRGNVQDRLMKKNGDPTKNKPQYASDSAFSTFDKLVNDDDDFTFVSGKTIDDLNSIERIVYENYMKDKKTSPTKMQGYGQIYFMFYYTFNPKTGDIMRCSDFVIPKVKNAPNNKLTLNSNYPWDLVFPVGLSIVDNVLITSYGEGDARSKLIKFDLSTLYSNLRSDNGVREFKYLEIEDNTRIGVFEGIDSNFKLKSDNSLDVYDSSTEDFEYSFEFKNSLLLSKYKDFLKKVEFEEIYIIGKYRNKCHIFKFDKEEPAFDKKRTCLSSYSHYQVVDYEKSQIEGVFTTTSAKPDTCLYFYDIDSIIVSSLSNSTTCITEITKNEILEGSKKNTCLNNPKLNRRLYSYNLIDSVEYFNNYDIVFTYVDGRDIEWQARYTTNFPGSTPAWNRYYPAGELQNSLRLIEKFCSGVNKIYIVTQQQQVELPSFKNSNFAKKVQIIDHTEIIPAKFLPTYNSVVIEAFLQNIPNLKENFIYCNDDFMFTNYLTKSHFFNEIGRENLYYKVFDKDPKDLAKKLIEFYTINGWNSNTAPSNKDLIDKGYLEGTTPVPADKTISYKLPAGESSLPLLVREEWRILALNSILLAENKYKSNPGWDINSIRMDITHMAVFMSKKLATETYKFFESSLEKSLLNKKRSNKLIAYDGSVNFQVLCFIFAKVNNIGNTVERQAGNIFGDPSNNDKKIKFHNTKLYTGLPSDIEQQILENKFNMIGIQDLPLSDKDRLDNIISKYLQVPKIDFICDNDPLLV